MSGVDCRDIVHRYYASWAAQDRDTVGECVAADLNFVSPEEKHQSADAFLHCCWKYSKSLAGVEFIKELYSRDDAFVLLRWSNEDGTYFYGAEYVMCESGKIKQILVVNNAPTFFNLVKLLR